MKAAYCTSLADAIGDEWTTRKQIAQVLARPGAQLQPKDLAALRLLIKQGRIEVRESRNKYSSKVMEYRVKG